MNEGDVVLIPMPQADGKIKNRPVMILRKMPPYGDFLVCGISAQLQQYVPDFDELIIKKDLDFPASGLVKDSVVRLSFLAIAPIKDVIGGIGSFSPERHKRLLKRLSAYLIENIK